MKPIRGEYGGGGVPPSGGGESESNERNIYNTHHNHP